MLPERQAVKVSGFCVVSPGGYGRGNAETGIPAREATGATVRWTQTGLEVVFDCTDNGIVAEQKGRDNIKLWKDDCVYVWLDPSHVHNATSNMVMLQVSVGGVVFDTRNNDAKFDIEGLDTAITRTAEGWRADIRMPWKGLGVACPVPGDVWGVNFSRMDQPGKTDYKKMEQSTWILIPSGDLGEVKRWGHIVFATADAKPDDKAVVDAQDSIENTHAVLRPMEVIANDGILREIPCGRDSLPLTAFVAVFPGNIGINKAKDLEVTLEPEGKVFRGTLNAGDVSFPVMQRVTEEAGGVVRIDLETISGGPMPKSGADDPYGIVYAIQIPAAQFVQGTYEAGDKSGSIPTVWMKDNYRLFQGKTGMFSLTDSTGQKLNVELEPAAEVTIQDSRKWSPNMHVHITARPGTLPKDEKTKLTIRLKMTNVAGQGFVKKESGEDVFGSGGSYYKKERLPTGAIPPWPSQYKLKPEDRDKLTAADVVGPDGVVYPNWMQVGVQGGIPDVPVAVKLDDLGVKPETDISGVLSNVINEVGLKGGGAILIGEGTYYLDRPVEIRQDGVVIRGSGRDATRLIFRYSLVTTNTLQAVRNYIEYGAFTFLGRQGKGKYHLAADARRGDATIELKEEPNDLRVGDKFVIVAWGFPKLARSQCPEGWVRQNKYEICAIDGHMLTIGQPLRIDYPRAETFLQIIIPVERCGVEDLTIEHTCKLMYHSVSSHTAWNCWARRVKVVRSGRGGVHFVWSKWCEVRDGEFDSCWSRGLGTGGLGGWGYGGFTWSQDCLMENCRWRNYRHAPQVQFGAQGNVIRNCTFDGSDAQWHAGWSTENLFENCVISENSQYGSYGFGMYSTPSFDKSHGPNGPRNVVYNCDVVSRMEGVYGRGTSENWLFLHNRFVVGNGPGFRAESGFFDAILRNNTFILQTKKWPMLMIDTADCVGFELIDNTLYGGNGKVVDGAAIPALDRGNRAFPAVSTNRAAADFPPRPVADPPSIYEWQKAPQIIYLNDCEQVLIEGITARDSCGWNIVPVLCRDLTFNRVNIKNPWKPYDGTEGIDLTSCSNVRITNCHIDTGDDGIALKSFPIHREKRRLVTANHVFPARTFSLPTAWLKAEAFL